MIPKKENIGVPQKDEHSERGPSTAARWRRCPGSVRMSRGLPDDAGMEAALGTVFHEFAALTVEFDVDQRQMVGSCMVVEANGVPVELQFDLEMATKMQTGIDFIRAYESEHTTTFVEKRVSLEEWVGEGEFGTSDCFVIDPVNRRILIFDWKWGAGVPVQPYMNDQAMLYFLGVWSTYARAIFRDMLADEIGEDAFEMADAGGAPWEDDIEVIIAIEQPRAPGGGGVWKTTAGEILAEGRKIKRDAEATEDPNAPCIPGEKQCQFCAASKHQTCTAERDYILSAFDQTTDDLDVAFLSGAELDLRDQKALTPEQRSALILRSTQIKKYLDALHAEAYIDAQNGIEVPGMFLADGRRPARKWKDEAVAQPILESRLKGDAWERKYLTPTAVEEVVGKAKYEKLFAHLVTQGDAKPQLVPAESGKTPIRSRREELDDAFDAVAQDSDTLI